MPEPDLKAPAKSLLWNEGWRAMLDFCLLPAAFPLLNSAPRGHGEPVMVLPGFGGGDSSTLALRLFLRRKGYTVYGWDQGINVGALGLLEPLRARLEMLAQKHDRKVGLVGWSLGGIYAREIAKLAPKHARCVVTLGSPFKGPAKASNVWRLYQWVSGHRVEEQDSNHSLAQTPSVPTTAIYTRSDGIVAWQRCVEAPDERVESVEVAGSHCGLGHNALALYTVADRLAQVENNWQPFAFRGISRRLYLQPWPTQAA